MKYIITAFSILLKQIKHAIEGIQARAYMLLQPHIQYYMALLLAAVLVFLLGWPTFLSTLAHIHYALLGRI